MHDTRYFIPWSLVALKHDRLCFYLSKIARLWIVICSQFNVMTFMNGKSSLKNDNQLKILRNFYKLISLVKIRVQFN